jgi:hypothetical protein
MDLNNVQFKNNSSLTAYQGRSSIAAASLQSSTPPPLAHPPTDSITPPGFEKN